jgi:hypothetical protein
MKRFLSGLMAVLVAAAALPEVSSQAIDPLGDVRFQGRVKQAVAKGVAWLQQGRHAKGHGFCKSGDRLILLTYIHAGANPDHPDFKAHLEKALTVELASTYDTVLIAMCLEALDRVRYQWRIHQCAQFLADNMGPEGQIHYGKPTKLPPAPGGASVTVSGGRSRTGVRNPSDKPGVRNVIHVRQQRVGPTDYDHSNMQYLALGLRACHDAGIRFDPDLIRKFAQWWKTKQILPERPERKPLMLDGKSSAYRSNTQAGFTVVPAGWDYDGGRINAGATPGAKASMTAGAVGALCIADYILGRDWRRNPNVLAGMQWLNQNFSVTEDVNGCHEGVWYYYYMYGLERAGMLYGTERIGRHWWYLEGARRLLELQSPQGGWTVVGKNKAWADPVRDTCFAILFIQRATHRLVYTG